MNALQQKTFELLNIFVGICEKWEIPYFLVCGSALGAAKYGGFIPWDDDVDVALLRADYQRFLEVAPGELPGWCFLQNYRTEPAFPHSFSKLRNSGTTFLEEGMAKLPINQGIYLDIFPLDGYPVAPLAQKTFELRKKWLDWIRFSGVEASTPKARLRNKLLRLLGLHKKTTQAQEKLEALCAKFSPKESDLWCNYGNWQGKLEYAPKWQYGQGSWAAFEGLRVRVPEKLEDYLTQKYGNWRADLPIEQQKSHHKGTIIDPTRPYTDYLQ